MEYGTVGSGVSLGKLIGNSPEKAKNKPKSENILQASSEDSVQVDLSGVYKSLAVLGEKIITELDSILAKELPEGIRSLQPEAFTPEATSDNIVIGITSLFTAFSAQNPELEGTEELDEFMRLAREGVAKGLSQAKKILGDLGAFEFDGVEDGINETMKLVEDKLLAFEQSKKEEIEKPQEEVPSEEEVEA